MYSTTTHSTVNAQPCSTIEVQNPTLFTGSSQRGITLVELMIATALMAILVVGAVQLYISTRSVDVIAYQATELYDNALYTFHELELLIGHIGYTEDYTQKVTNLANSFLADPTHGFAAGQVLTGTENPGGSDTLKFRLSGSSTRSIRDCRGVILSTDEVAIISLSITDGTLTCSNTVVRKTDPTITVAATQQVALLRDALDMEIMFRTITNSGGFAFLTAPNVVNWSEIRGISIMYALSSAQAVQFPTSQTVTLFDTTHTEASSGQLIKPFLFTYSIEQKL